MEVCLTINGVRHCYVIPVLAWPVHFPKPGPGPVNFPELFQDAMILASMTSLLQNVASPAVNRAVQEGLAAGIKALQQHGGEHVHINDRAAMAHSA